MLIPSLLAFPRADWAVDLPHLLSRGHNVVHFDVMDEETVHNTAFTPADLQFLTHYPFRVRVHLMVARPWEVAPSFFLPNVDSFTFECAHLEEEEIHRTLAVIRGAGYKGGIAIRPDYSAYQPYLKECDTVTVMGVKPGRGGQPLDTRGLANLRTVATFRATHNLGYTIEFDGGVNAETIHNLLPPPDFIVSGYYLYHRLKDEGWKPA